MNKTQKNLEKFRKTQKSPENPNPMGFFKKNMDFFQTLKIIRIKLTQTAIWALSMQKKFKNVLQTDLRSEYGGHICKIKFL